jgi:hypothetical protein
VTFFDPRCDVIWARCRHCGRDIYRLGEVYAANLAANLGLPEPGPQEWWHRPIDGRASRTCRAASYDPETGWDERFDRAHGPSAEPA